MGRKRPLLRLGFSGVVGIELVLKGRGMNGPSWLFGGGLDVEDESGAVSFMIMVGGSVRAVGVGVAVVSLSTSLCKVFSVS